MKIVTYPDPILLQAARSLDGVDDGVRAKIEEMKQLMVLEDGVGLAAPQVGWSAKIFLASEDGLLENTQVFVNPKIVEERGGQEWGEEGCLSFPGIFGEVRRHVEVEIEALDENGQPFRQVAEGFFARVLQHETDHLNGRLFVTKMRPADRAANRKLLDELRERHEARQNEASSPGSWPGA